MATVPVELSLDDAPSLALARLVPLLGCGEEAAALSFDVLSTQSAQGSALLATIAQEERVHDALLRGLLAALPAVEPPSDALRRARAMHVALADGGTALRCARIAALDSAVCTLLSALLHGEGAVARNPVLNHLFSQIRDDEARHVVATRSLALRSPVRQVLRDAAAETRGRLARLLEPDGAAFDLLKVDPDRLFARIARLPNGLLPA